MRILGAWCAAFLLASAHFACAGEPMDLNFFLIGADGKPIKITVGRAYNPIDSQEGIWFQDYYTQEFCEHSCGENIEAVRRLGALLQARADIRRAELAAAERPPLKKADRLPPAAAAVAVR